MAADGAIFQITPMELADCVAKAFGLKVGSIAQFQPGDASLLPERLCRELGIVQLWLSEQTACFAISDPRLSDEQSSRLRFAAARNIELVILPPDDIDTCLTRFFAASAGRQRTTKPRSSICWRAHLPTDNAPIVKLACALLRTAIDRNASDVHIHPFVGGGAIRFRIDGRMRRIATIPDETLGACRATSRPTPAWKPTRSSRRMAVCDSLTGGVKSTSAYPCCRPTTANASSVACSTRAATSRCSKAASRPPTSRPCAA